MIVTSGSAEQAVEELKRATYIGFDTETTGLRPFHGDRIFSLIFAADIDEMRQKFYFNFWPYDDVAPSMVLPKAKILSHLQKELFSDPDKWWFAHNAKFDLHMLAAEGVKIAGHVHCTKSIGRVCYNEYQSYSLEDSLERIGEEKDPAVERYIEENKCFQLIDLPHRKQRDKRKFYYLVPFDIIVPYGEKDAAGTLDLGYHQLGQIKKLDDELPEGVPYLANVYYNECQLTKTIQRMEQNGCRIDPTYCEDAQAFETAAMDAALGELNDFAGGEFKDSGKCLSEIFKGNEASFTYGKPSKVTGKVQPTFASDVLDKIDHPAVDALLRYRGAKSRAGFYGGFLYHRDEFDIVHPSFNPDVARHGRFSSSNPNFQNLTKPETDELRDDQFYVRRAIIPREGNVFLMPDWRGMEYAMMLEYACRLAGRVVPLAQRVNDGMKIHQATVEMCREKGMQLTIDEAKPANFLTLYEGGPTALAGLLKCSKSRAEEIQDALTRACPEMKKARERMIHTARTRGYVFNWFGRRCWFPVPKFAYRAPNYIDSGGCADVMKIVMNQVQDYLTVEGKETLLVCTIHDELVLDSPVHEAREVAEVVVQCMESAFPAQYVPLKVDMEWSDISLADKRKGFPT